MGVFLAPLSIKKNINYFLKEFIINELPRSRAARYQKEFLFNPDAEHRGIRLIKADFQFFRKKVPSIDYTSTNPSTLS